MKKLSARSIQEIRTYAEERGIDVEGLNKTKILEAIEEKEGGVITLPERKSNPQTSATTNENGVLISPQPEAVKTKIVPEVPPHEQPDKVAIFSQRNISWPGVGKVEKGYNFVSREVADKWVQHKAVREATPEDVARHFGIN